MSAPLPQPPAVGQLVRLAVFAAGEVEYAVAGRVPRSLPAPSPLPRAVRHAEALYPVVDLAEAFGLAAAPGGERLLFLVEDGAVRRALVVERLVGAESFDLERVEPIPEIYPEAERRRFRGLLLRPDGGLVVLLRLEALAAGGGIA
jgi:hypothetical protein